MYKNKDKKIRTDYQKHHFILDALSKVILNLLSTGLLLFFGYWLFFTSNMGSAYLPNFRDGAFNMSIRFTLIGLAALVWLLTPIWFLWSSALHCYNSYQAYKCRSSADSLI